MIILSNKEQQLVSQLLPTAEYKNNTLVETEGSYTNNLLQLGSVEELGCRLLDIVMFSHKEYTSLARSIMSATELATLDNKVTERIMELKGVAAG